MNANLPNPEPRGRRLSSDAYSRAAEVAALFPEPTIDLDRLVCESCGRRGPSVGPVVLGGSCYIACARCAPAEQSCAGEAGERP